MSVGPGSVKPIAKLAAIIVVLCGYAIPARADALDSLRLSVFKIHVQSRSPVFDSPWQKTATAGSSGTGFYIGEGRIMTNAHVVAGAAYIAVQRDGDPAPEPAFV